MGDFPTDAVLNHTHHRPWPMPTGPWVMTQSWHHLLFAHWPVDVATVRANVPAPLEVDLHDGTAWIGVVPFDMTNVAPRYVPSVPGLSHFPELNVRTYVSYGGKPGVYFFSLDARRALAVVLARLLVGLPYFKASMRVTREGDWTRYRSRRLIGMPAQFAGRYRPTGAPFNATPTTLEYFLTERYCLYTVDAHGQVHRVQIHHPPWPLQPAEAEITMNTVSDAAGIAVPTSPPVVHYAARQDMVVFAPEAA